jgi:hypothetical protein
MTENIFERLAGDWFHRAGHLHHHGDTIAASHPSARPAQGDPVSLKTILDEGRIVLEDGEAKVRQFLDQHVPQIAGLADLIENNRIFQSAEAALHVPPQVLDGVAALLDHYAAAYPKPEAAPEPIAEAPAELAPQPA